MRLRVVILFWTAFSLSAVASKAQQVPGYLIIKKTNGVQQSFPLDSIRSVELKHGSVEPKYTVAKVYAYVSSLYGLPFYGSNLDSFTFSTDPNKGWMMHLALDTANGYPRDYRVFSSDDKMELGLDSITIRQYERNPSLNLISNVIANCDGGPKVFANFYSALWTATELLAYSHLHLYYVDGNSNIQRDSLICPYVDLGLAPSLDPSNRFVLYVASRQSNVSIGVLRLFDRQTGTASSIKGMLDQSVSRAIYLSPDSILYYSYGSWTPQNNSGPDAGYYLFDLKTNQKHLLFHHLSGIGAYEVVNGFDVSPDLRYLVYGDVSDDRSPIIKSFEFATQQISTLPVTFGEGAGRPAIWLKYNSTGSQLVYSSYPLDPFGQETVYHGSELGLINTITWQNKVMAATPTTEGDWVCTFPQWSPDDRHLVYGLAHILDEPRGYLDLFQLAILDLP